MEIGMRSTKKTEPIRLDTDVPPTAKNSTMVERILVELLEDITLASEAERVAWERLEQYLADGTIPRRVQIRIQT
jgi:hypothetical protein